MALVKKVQNRPIAVADDNGAAESVGQKQQIQRQAEAERRRARTMAKQQQVTERIASATTQLPAASTKPPLRLKN
ncbi:MAG: hypothetical protein IPL59_00590 [Candidatus Competibacteraceae bacterium]|nr:hypothetical protein [Candidatus Competibacteraceae bacterium]